MSKQLLRPVAVTCTALALTTLTACASSGGGFSARSSTVAQGKPGVTSSVSTTSGAHAGPVTAWFRTVGPVIQTLEQSITTAQWAVRRPNDRGLTSACHTIRTNVATARAAEPVPDRTAHTALVHELDEFDVAAAQCLNGDLEAAGASVERGHRYAEVAGRRIVTLVHRGS